MVQCDYRSLTFKMLFSIFFSDFQSAIFSKALGGTTQIEAESSNYQVMASQRGADLLTIESQN